MVFWGLILKAQKVSAEQKPDEPVQISNIALSQVGYHAGTPVKVFMQTGNLETLLCTLDGNNRSHKTEVCFEKEDGVTFRVAGEGQVHLTGKLDPREEDSEDSGTSAESEESSYDSVKEAIEQKKEMKERREKGNRHSRMARFRIEHRNN